MTIVNDQRLGGQEAAKLNSLQTSELSSFQAKIVTDISDVLKHSTNQQYLELIKLNDFSSRHYDNDEVNRIIRRALKLKNEDTISHQDLIDTARDIGLDPHIVETAIEQEQREFKKEKIRKARLKRRKVGFYSHLWSYLIVNGALLLINNFTPGPWWFQWSVLGWGIGLAFHFKAIYFPHVSKFKTRRKSRYHRVNFMMCNH